MLGVIGGQKPLIYGGQLGPGDFNGTSPIYCTALPKARH